MIRLVTLCVLTFSLAACAAKQNGSTGTAGANGGAAFTGNWVFFKGQYPIDAQLSQAETSVSGPATLADVSINAGYAWLAGLSGCSELSGNTGTAVLNGQTVPTLTVAGCGAYTFADGELSTGADGEQVIETTDGSWFAFQPTWSNFSLTKTLLVQAETGGVGASQIMPVQISLTNNGNGTATVSVLPLPSAPWECLSTFQDTGNFVGGAFVSGSIKIQYTDFPETNNSRVITGNFTPVANCDDSQGEIYFVTGSF